MSESVIRNFTVKGKINSQFTPVGGSPTNNNIAGQKVELWHKGPMETAFLGSGLTDTLGEFKIEFTVNTPSVVVINGKINNVFLKVIYDQNVIIGDLDTSAGSFD